MSEKKNTVSSTRNKASKLLLQGRFFSLDFFKRNWYYVVFIVAMALAYIGNKFSSQRSIQELIALKTELANAQTDLVNASAKYNSMIRESQMVNLMNEKHLNLTPPLDPPYELNSH